MSEEIILCPTCIYRDFDDPKCPAENDGYDVSMDNQFNVIACKFYDPDPDAGGGTT